MKTNPVHKVPTHLMEGVGGKEFLVNNRKDKEEVERVVSEATKEVLRRTGGAGFPLLCNPLSSEKLLYTSAVAPAPLTPLLTALIVEEPQ